MASTNVGSIHYDLDLKTDKFDSAAKNIGNKIGDIGKKMTSIGKSMTVGVTLPIVAGFGYAIKQASDFNETINKIDVAFKDQSASVKKWANTSITSMGLAKASALDAAALFGDMSTAMGLNTEEAAKMSTSLVQLGADLASFKNISFERAQTALAGVYTGETEALKGLGIVMTQTNLEEFARAQGISKSIDKMTQAEKVQLRYAYVMSVTTNAQGDFVRTSDGFANQLRMMQERVKELSADIGARLLPYGLKLLKWVGDLMDKFKTLTPAQQDMIIKIAAIAAAIGPLLIVLGSLVSAIGVLIPLLSSGVFWAVAAVFIAIGAAVKFAYDHWDIIRQKLEIVINLFHIVQDAVKFLTPIIKDQLGAALRDLQAAWTDLYNETKPYHEEIKMVAKFILGTLVVAIIAFIAVNVALTVIIARVIGWLAKFVAIVVHTGAQIGAFLGGIKARMEGFGASLRNILFGAGAEMVRGLMRGIDSATGGLMSKAAGIANKIASVFKSALKIKSPSRVFFGFGENIVQGLVDGINNTKMQAKATVENMSSVVAQPPQLGAGGTTIYGNVNIGKDLNTSSILQQQNRNQDLLGLGLATIGGM